MPSGSCLCGAIKISFEGEPIAQGTCHCWSCRKLGGSTYSTNSVVKPEDFKVTGDTPKSYSSKADNGNTITNYFCGICSSPLWGEGGFGPNKVMRMGIMDGDGLEGAKPMLEVFSERRVNWVAPVDGAISVIGMGDSQKVVADNAA